MRCDNVVAKSMQTTAAIVRNAVHCQYGARLFGTLHIARPSYAMSQQEFEKTEGTANKGSDGMLVMSWFIVVKGRHTPTKHAFRHHTGAIQ